MSGVVAGAALLYLGAMGIAWFVAALLWFAHPHRWQQDEGFPRRRDWHALTAVVWTPVLIVVGVFGLALGVAWTGSR